jgi:hypothetical protein
MQITGYRGKGPVPSNYIEKELRLVPGHGYRFCEDKHSPFQQDSEGFRCRLDIHIKQN